MDHESPSGDRLRELCDSVDSLQSTVRAAFNDLQVAIAEKVVSRPTSAEPPEQTLWDRWGPSVMTAMASALVSAALVAGPSYISSQRLMAEIAQKQASDEKWTERVDALAGKAATDAELCRTEIAKAMAEHIRDYHMRSSDGPRR